MRKKSQQAKEQDSNSSTSKRFSTLSLRKKKQARPTDQKPQSQQLLTQCIETALFLDPVDNNDKRWSFEDVRPSSLRFEQEPIKPARTRKISLPPQLSNIGYLASIPEVDSQVTLDIYHSEACKK
jgi:hypothetical protein